MTRPTPTMRMTRSPPPRTTPKTSNLHIEMHLRAGLLTRAGPFAFQGYPMHSLIFMDIEPMPTPRPRARAIKTKGGKSFVSMYNPAEYTEWKDEAVALLHKQGITAVFDKPVRVEAKFLCTQPKSTKLYAPKPDIDNYVKGLLDAVTQAGWWTDDTLVHQLLAEKAWAGHGVPGS